MKIALMSDSHNNQDQVRVPDADMLIHSGDFSDNERQALAFANWFRNLPHRHKVIIPGNHDRYAAFYPSILREAFGPEVTYLENQGVEIEGFNIWGSPQTPTFGYGWAFNSDRGGDIRRYWDKIPENTHILITHGPPMGILDTVLDYQENMQHVGCEELLARLHHLKELKLHVFGHIHPGYGVSTSAPYGLSVNTALCNDRNQLVRQPRVIEL